VTVNEPLDEFPDESVAVQVTVVVPSGNVEPDGWSQLMLGSVPLSSVAVTVYETTAPEPLVASAGGGDRTVITGGVVSGTVSVTVTSLDALLVPSVQSIVVVPTGKW
jgi:hypothetical protein